MNILVIGGSRFIGRAAVARLADAGHRLTLFNRGRVTDGPPGANTIVGDRFQLAEHLDALLATEPEVVLDMIPIVDRHGQELVDAFGGRRLVFISSCDVYRAYGLLHGSETGEPEPTPLDEDSPLRTVAYPYRTPDTAEDSWAYRYDKIPGERAVLAAGGTVLRLPMVYGPGDYQRRILGYLRRMDDARPAILLDEAMARWRTCRGYVDNVGAAIAAAVTDPRAAGRVYNVADEPSFDEAAWVRRLAAVVGWRGEVKVVPTDDLPESMRFGAVPQDLTVSTARLRDELGWRERVGVDEALAATAAWDRANPPENQPPIDYAAEDEVLSRLG